VNSTVTLTLRTLAEKLDAELQGDGDLVITALAPIEVAEHGQLAFVANKKYAKHLPHTRASAVILSLDLEITRDDLATLRMADPYIGFVKALRLFHPFIRYQPAGIHPSSVIHADAVIADDVTIAANAVVAAGVRIGRGSIISEGVVLRDGATVGEYCLLYPNVTVLDRCLIGNRVIIHSGTVIGSDGFGFAPHEGKYEKIPQVGNVVIEDDVEIGANCAIDRATLGSTTIRRGSKLDNLLQIAHNVDVGEDSVIAAQSGVSGSTVLGRNVILAGQVGLVGHIEIGDKVTISAQSGVAKSLHGPGKMFRGSPAREIHEELRLEAAMRHLPELIKTVRSQEQRIRDLEKLLEDKEVRS